MKLRYRGVTFDSGTIDPRMNRDFQFNDARQAIKAIHTWDLVGFCTINEAIGETQTSLTAKIQAIESAFAQNGGDLEMLFDDGSPSAHLIRNSETIGGTRVANGPNWDPGPGQYANWRSFTARVVAELPVSGTFNGLALASFSETLEFFGGGQQDEYALSLEGLPVREKIYGHVPYGAVQSGRIVGLYAWPVLPVPIFFGALKRRMDTPYTADTAPQPTGATGGIRYENYSRAYRYEFESAFPLIGSPAIWNVF